MTLLHSHHPTHCLKVVGDSLARYVLLILHIYLSNASRIIAWVWVFVIKNNSNPYPHNYPTCVWSIYVKNNPTKVHFVLNIVKSHSETTKTNFARHYRPFLRTTGIQQYSRAARFKSVSLQFYGNILPFFENDSWNAVILCNNSVISRFWGSHNGINHFEGLCEC